MRTPLLPGDIAINVSQPRVSAPAAPLMAIMNIELLAELSTAFLDPVSVAHLMRVNRNTRRVISTLLAEDAGRTYGPRTNIEIQAALRNLRLAMTTLGQPPADLSLIPASASLTFSAIANQEALLTHLGMRRPETELRALVGHSSFFAEATNRIVIKNKQLEERYRYYKERNICASVFFLFSLVFVGPAGFVSFKFWYNEVGYACLAVIALALILNCTMAHRRDKALKQLRENRSDYVAEIMLINNAESAQISGTQAGY